MGHKGLRQFRRRRRRKLFYSNNLRKNPTKCFHALASYYLVGLEAGFEERANSKNLLCMWTGGAYVLPATFRGQICPPCEGLPYFVPHLTASSIWTYSVSCVPYHLCLALVFGHRPTNRELPCQYVCIVKDQKNGCGVSLTP